MVLIFIGGVGLFFLSQSVATNQPTPTAIEATFENVFYPTPIPSNTLDAWSATGTALVFRPSPSPSATIDYCWFLTPTATRTAIPLYTPDAWSATGTAIWRTENPPTPYIEPTATTPRSWCDVQLSATPIPSATLTPMPSATLAAMPTRTAQNIQPVNPQPVVIQSTPAPVVIQPTPAPVTSVPTATKTKKPKKTKTPTPTLTPNIYAIFVDCTAGPLAIVQADGAIDAIWFFERDGIMVASGSWSAHEITMPSSAVALVIGWDGAGGLYRLHVNSVMLAEILCVSNLTSTPTPTLTPTPTIEPEITLEPIVTPTPEGAG